MGFFNKLSVVAQYDDLCRCINKFITDGVDYENASIRMVEQFEKRWWAREANYEQSKKALLAEIASLQKEVKKKDRHLTESRAALVRESEEKKTILRERKSLWDKLKQVRALVESKNSPDTFNAHRERVMNFLNIERLSPIQSDDSDDCVSGLDYDRTEDDILDPVETRSPANKAVNNTPGATATNEQPTLLYRYLEKESDNEDPPLRHVAAADQLRRSSRLSSQQRYSERAEALMRADQTRDKYPNLPTDTDSQDMETDENDIEKVRQQLIRAEQQMTSVKRNASVRSQGKAATLSARSAANMMKSVSTVSTPVSNTQKLHSFITKRIFRPENCGPCGNKIAFYGNAVKCENCGATAHPECKEKCPLPCVKITAPAARSRQKKVLISDYVNKEANPKVPALIVHCCNEIERGENITTEGLYRVVARTSDIEDLQQKILKSKSGMPNLSKADVHLLTGVVKRFLQSLDESLITTTLWSHFSEAVKAESAVEMLSYLTYYIKFDLPAANRDTLAFFMQHLHAIAKNSDTNKMNSKSLAKTLAPTLVGNSCRNPEQTTILRENKIQIQIMEALFNINEEFWAEFVQREESQRAQSAASFGSRLLGTPSSTTGVKTRSSRFGSTLPTPKLKPLFS